MEVEPGTAEQPVISPFANAESRSKEKSNRVAWIASGSLGFIVILVLGFVVANNLSDPMRTLEPFPASRYFENYKSLAGSKFRAKVRVEADLGWKEGTGRLMLFTNAEDSRPFAVLVPFAVAKDLYFTKGQQFDAELEVREGGLIYGNRFKKG